MRMISITSWLIIGFLVISLFFMPMQNTTAMESDDMQVQLKNMEDMMRKQQVMIDDMKTRIEIQEEIKQTTLTAIDEGIIGEKVDEYFQKGEGKGIWSEVMKRPKLGYKKGFYFETPNKDFSMKINGRIQFRYSYEDRDNVMTRMRNRMTAHSGFAVHV